MKEMTHGYQEKNLELCRRIQRGDKDAESELIMLNDGFVHTQVNRVKERHMLSHLYEYEDCVQDCRIALLESAKTYDFGKGSFSTYASWSMFAAVSKNWEERFSAHIPKNVSTKCRLGREERSSVLALYERVQNTVSLDEIAYTDDDDEVYYEDLIVEERIPQAEDIAIDNDTRRLIYKQVLTLTPREQKVLILRFGLDGNKEKTLDEVGRVMCVTRERVRQIEAKALRKLRHPDRLGRLYREGCEVASDFGTDELRRNYGFLLNPPPEEEAYVETERADT